MKEFTEERIELYSPPKEHLLHQFIISLSGALILISSLLVFIFSPGKSTTKLGTVVDIYHSGITHKEDNTHVHVLLENGEVKIISKPKWLHFSEYDKVLLQETKSLFGGIKRYSLYKEVEQQPLESAYHLPFIRN